jgi:hypothetical protein
MIEKRLAYDKDGRSDFYTSKTVFPVRNETID